MTGDTIPLAARFGLKHVSVAECSTGRWAAMSWAQATGPCMIGSPCGHMQAVALAMAYAEATPLAILDLPAPPEQGSIHVQKSMGGGLEVLHEGRSGNSFATLRRFDACDRDHAVSFALSQLTNYNAKLGRVHCPS